MATPRRPKAPRSAPREGLHFVGPTRIPWSPERPLLFHVLTGTDHNEFADTALCAMLAEGVAVAPFECRGEDLSGLTTQLGDEDRECGDGAWLFLSAGRPYRSPDMMGGRAAVAFYADEVLGLDLPVAWRCFDAISRVATAGRGAKGDARRERMREAAEALTWRDPKLVAELVRLEVDRFAAAGDEAAQSDLLRYIARVASGGYVVGHPWRYDAPVRWDVTYRDRLDDLLYPWERSLAVARGQSEAGSWPGALSMGGGAEILVGGPLPLRLAAFCRSGESDRWYRRADFLRLLCTAKRGRR